MTTTIIRTIHNKTNPYVQLSKDSLWDQRLSFKAVGLWARCMSRPDDWSFNITEIAKKAGVGRKTVDRILPELIEAGYALRLDAFEKNIHGKFTNRIIEYFFFEFPATEEDKKRCVEEFQKVYGDSHFGKVRESDIQKGALLNTEDTKDIKIQKNILVLEESRTSQSIPKEIPKKERPPEATEIANDLWSRVLQLYPQHKPPKMDDWIRDVDLMHRADSRAWEDIRRVIAFVFDDDFWAKVVSSPSGIRKNFDMIMAKMTPIDNRGTRIQRNRAMAQEAKSVVKNNIDKWKNFYISDASVVRLDTNETVTLDSDPKIFEAQIMEMFGLKKT
jgi:hypothetical protein